MRFSHDGEWTVSTPIYVGSDADLRKAIACPHRTYTKVTEDVKHGTLMIMERCADCVATRVRSRPQGGTEGE